jgi:hypothetical protein
MRRWWVYTYLEVGVGLVPTLFEVGCHDKVQG